jgi:hypothetical protein
MTGAYDFIEDGFLDVYGAAINQSSKGKVKSMEKELFDDLVEALNESIEYEKGNIQLKTTTLEIPD